MNPPFTDRGKLTDQMLAARIQAFNERQNYWAYFLFLAHDLLAAKGTIAAVLPRLFLAGSTSREVRNWIFNTLGYDLLYIVRTTKEFAFSESAAFRLDSSRKSSNFIKRIGALQAFGLATTKLSI